MFKKHVLSAAAAMVVGGVVSAPAQAQVSINGGVQARIGALSRSGDTAPNHSGTVSSIDGLYNIFLTATKDLKGGYNAGFFCHTVATTAHGAGAGFNADDMPIRHGWDKVFAGAEAFPQNGHGGFASYGNSNGDSNGPFCNDEVFGFLETPYGRFNVGNIMNPMRQAYDQYTVDPVWGNQRGYYVAADIRGTAAQYSNSFGQFNAILHLNTASDTNATTKAAERDKGITGFLSYDFGGGTVLGVGVMQVRGGIEAKMVVPDETRTHYARSLSAKTLVGPISLGYTFFTGARENDTGAMLGNKITDNTLKIGYDTGKWNFQAFLSSEKLHWDTLNPDGGAKYTVVMDGPFQGATFKRVDIKRQRADLWALYDMGNGTRTYVRLDTITKKWTSEELAGFSAKMNSTKLEGGWLITF